MSKVIISLSLNEVSLETKRKHKEYAKNRQAELEQELREKIKDIEERKKKITEEYKEHMANYNEHIANLKKRAGAKKNFK